MAYDNRPNLSCKQFDQQGCDYLYLAGHNCVCGTGGTISSNSGYQISGYTIFNASGGGSIPSAIRIGHNANNQGESSIAVGFGAQACCMCGVVIGCNNISRSCGGNIIGGFGNIICSGNTNSTLIGVNNCTINANCYTNSVIVPNLVILTSPTGSGGYLCYNPTTKKVEQTTGGGGTASGENLTKLINQPSHGFNVNCVVGWSSGAYTLPTADGTYNGEVLGIVSKCYNANCFELTQAGYVTGLTGLVTNTTYFLSPTTAGQLTAIEPSGATQISKAVLVATSSSSAWVLPYPGYVISTGATPGGGGTITGATNGLSISNKNVVLGGNPLTGHTIINANSKDFCINGARSIMIQSNVTGYGTTLYGYNSYLCGSNFALVCSPQVSISFDTTGYVYDTAGTPNGLRYGGNYRSTFLCDSLVDAAYVTGKTSTAGAVTGATNLGSGSGTIYTSISNKNLQLKTLSGGTNVTLTCNGSYVGINATNYWSKTSTCISPATVGDNILLDNGATICWKNGTVMRSQTGVTGNIWCVNTGNASICTDNSGLIQLKGPVVYVSNYAATNYMILSPSGGICGVTGHIEIGPMTKTDATQACHVCILGGYNQNLGLGGHVYVCGGRALSNTGGNVYIDVNNGGGTKGCAILCGLQAKTTETCAVYINASGKLSYGCVSGGTGGGVTGATNLGSGNGTIYTTTSASKINLKTLSGGTNVTLTCNGNYIGINATGGATISGTKDYVAKFNATGNNICNSSIYDSGTTDICITKDNVIVGNPISGTATIKAHDHPTTTINLIIKPGTCLGYVSGHRDGYLYLDPGRGVPYHSIFLGSPTFDSPNVFIQPAGTTSNMGLYLCAKNNGIVAIFGDGGTYMGSSTNFIGLFGDCLSKVSCNNFCIIGNDTSVTATTACSLFLRGGNANAATGSGGNLILRSGTGTTANGRIYICGLPSSVQTCGIYIDSLGRLSTGVISGGTGGGIGWSNATNGSTIAGCCTIPSGTIHNTYYGVSAGTKTTSGGGNVAVGFGTLRNNIVGSGNTAIGNCAMYYVSGDSQNNVAIGNRALFKGVNTWDNVAIGCETLYNNTNGYINIAIGEGAMYCNNSGQYNIAMGWRPLYCNKTGWSNIALGTSALFCNNGCNNIAMGDGAVSANRVGCYNIGIGQQALALTVSGGSNIAIGYQALNHNLTASNLIAIGYQALHNNTCTGVGVDGINNIALGYRALSANTTGVNNTAIGNSALNSNTVGGNNTAIGHKALFNNNGSGYNIAIGSCSLSGNTGSFNVALGWSTMMRNGSGSCNIAVGIGALGCNTTASNNVAIGQQALCRLSTGSNNTAVGNKAGYTNTVGTGNTFIGSCVGYNETGSGKLYIDNSATATPLIYGEFNNKRLCINGTLEVSNNSGTNYLYLGDQNTNGSWRFLVSGSSLVVQVRTAGVWGGNKVIAP